MVNRLPASRRAVTLPELLIVIVVVAILAAILFVVFGGARRKGFEVRELNQLRQIFTAVNLYEQDYDHQPPISLVSMVPAYLPANSLACPSDVRLTVGFKDYPANPWAFYYFGQGSPLNDPDSIRTQRSPFLNSYVYLRTFIAHIPAGHSYDEYRNNPSVGLILGTGLLQCGKALSASPIQGCDYRQGGADFAANVGQPPMNTFGSFITIRTDGSAVTRQKPYCGDNSIGFQTGFLFEDPHCSPP